MNIFERHINDEVLGKDQIQKTLERVQTSDPQWKLDDLEKLRSVINKLQWTYQGTGTRLITCVSRLWAV